MLIGTQVWAATCVTVTPIHGFIEPGAAVDFDVTRNVSYRVPLTVHRQLRSQSIPFMDESLLTIRFCEASNTASDARDALLESASVQTRYVPCSSSE